MSNKLAKETNDSIRRKFNVREYAFNSVYERHRFNPEINHDIANFQVYRSYYWHTEEIEQYYNTNLNEEGKNTLSGYNGEVWTDWFILDYDSDDLTKSLSESRTYLRYLEASYDLNLDAVRVNFSGSKGFHIRIPAILFSGFEPSNRLPELMKTIFYKLTEGFSGFDDSIYKTTSLIRVFNTRNKKSELHAIPLSLNELFSLSIDQIKELAKSNRDVEYLDVEEFEPNELLVELKDECSNVPQSNNAGKKVKPKVVESTSFEGVEEGSRTNSLTKLMGRWISKGMNLAECEALAISWNEQNTPPLQQSELIYQVRSMFKNFSKTRGKFYSISEDKVVNIDNVKLLDYYEKEGFGKIYKFEKILYVKSDNRILHQVDIPQIKDYLRYEIENSPHRNVVLSELIKGNNKYFGQGFIDFLKPMDAKLIRDKKNEAFLFYKNVWLTVEGGGNIITHDYSELNGYIWQNNIIDRDFEVNSDFEGCDFSRFLFYLSGEDLERFEAIKSIIGYLLHTYKDPSNAKAILLMDEKISDNPNGRSGKSLLTLGISKMRKTKRLDGKMLKLTGDDRFSLQEIDVDDYLIDFNDVKRSFPFEQLFSMITDTLPVEKKKEQKFSIPFHESPKIVISTNYTLRGVGDSFKDRYHEVEISDFFSASRKPMDIFGRRFFDDWDSKEWRKFDNFMISCLSLYLEKGIIKTRSLNITTRRLYNETSKEFVEFTENNIEAGEEYNLNTVYNSFIRQNIDYSGIKQNTFTKWLKIYCELLELNFTSRDSNGKRYVTVEK